MGPNSLSSNVSATKNELDESLALISRELEMYFLTDQLPSLNLALKELQLLQAAMQQLGLKGVGIFCSELIKLLQEISATDTLAMPLQQDVTRRALFELACHLNTVVEGENCSALPLFPVYQELHQVRGLEMAFEAELFFPDLNVALPEDILHLTLEGDPTARLKAARMQYQQALLKWLRSDHVQLALQAMQASIQSTLLCAPPDSARAFWWIASGFMDCLLHESEPENLSTKKLLSQIDRKMKALLDHGEFDTESVLNEMLYCIACSGQISNTVARIKQVYALDACLGQESLLPETVTAAVLGEMKILLNETELSWESYVSGNTQNCEEFLKHVRHLDQLAAELDKNTLQPLCGEIVSFSGRAVNYEQSQRITLDMAMALILLRKGIDHYSQLGDSFHKQVHLLTQHMQAGITGAPDDPAGMLDLSILFCEMNHPAVAPTLSAQMRANLQHIKQCLDNFFADTSKHNELSRADHELRQIDGGLHFLSLAPAEKIIQKLRQIIESYIDGTEPSANEKNCLMAAVILLDKFLSDLEQGQIPPPSALTDILQKMGALFDDTIETPLLLEEKELVPEGLPVRGRGEDEELLEVFLEEADEVLRYLHSNTLIIQGTKESRDTLTDVRRAFHTLKGSSRMVGLKELGEVAWAIERAMNKWLQEERPATPELMEMVQHAETLFRRWVEMLHNNDTTTLIDARSLLALADKIEHKDKAAHIQTMVDGLKNVPIGQTDVESPASIAQQETITIGVLSLSLPLFNIATEEAAAHLHALQEHLQILRNSTPALVSHDFMRSAHTLAGVNRTLGFTHIAELALALELWLEARIDKQLVVSDEHMELLGKAIHTLDEMCACVRDRQEPPAQAELIKKLNMLREIQAPPDVVALPAIQTPTEVLTENTSITVNMHDTESRIVNDEIDAQLLPIFLEEANEIYPQICKAWRLWCKQDDNSGEQGLILQRLLHTLKGSARMAGVMRLGELTHRIEDIIGKAIAQSRYDIELCNELQNCLDRLGNGIEELANQEIAAKTITDVREKPKQTADMDADRTAAILRVRSDIIDKLVNQTGEVSVARSRVELEMHEFKTGILELTDSIQRLRQQLREIEIQAESQIQARTSTEGDSAEKFDPLEFDRYTRLQELTRFMNESVHDVQTIQQTLLKSISESETVLSMQGQINRELQQGLMAMRMVPFSSINERLYRVVRQTSKELGKRVNLELSGTEVELDRSILEKMAAPFEHLIRNAIAHGLEAQPQRENLGKPAIGEIRLSLRQANNEIIFEFSDDGAGLDLARLKKKALERGLIDAEEEISEELAAQLIFKPGFSTAQEITEISGRGVGMDVVRSEVSALGGRVDMVSTRGKGVKFTIHLPLTLAVSKTLMVRANKQMYAIPATMVEQVQQLKPQALETVYSAHRVEWQGNSYPLFYLASLLSDRPLEPVSRPYNALILIHGRENRIALHVDELIGNQEVVVKNIGPQLSRLQGIAGATITSNGAVVLILNPIVFAQQFSLSHKPVSGAEIAEPVHKVPLVMVVDDSLTVRMITSRLLSRFGYEVVTAKDGEDALERLADVSPAIMLLDVEMPRMDGFELTKRLRRESTTKDLPIIMITSRTAQKHREYAMEIGVNEYLGKPYQEEMLMACITRFAPLSEIDVPI